MNDKNNPAALRFKSNAKGTRLALHAFPAEQQKNHSGPTPVLLAHGTFSNHRSCRGVAQYLSRRGFDCWVLDFQGHGRSDKPKQEPDFESMCLQDTAAALDFVRQQYPGQKLHWIGHSGGGLAIIMYLARHSSEQSLLASIVTLASQATDAAQPIRNRIAIRLAAMLTSILRVAPGKWLKLGPENEFADVMQQWYHWSLSNTWQGCDGFDYLKALPQIKIPILTIAASGDHFIAPPSGCRKLHDLYGSESKSWLLFGQEAGYLEDYTHSRIISSRNASIEVWPKIREWLNNFNPDQMLH